MTRKSRIDGRLDRAFPAHITIVRAPMSDMPDDEGMPKNMTLRLSFSSETPYLRSSWFDEPWIEVLGHKDGEVDLSRLMDGAAPVLCNHVGNTGDIPMRTIGVVERAWVEDGKGYADIKLSRRDGMMGLISDIEDGILRNVSVGYQIQERVLTKANGGKMPDEYRVTRWLPMEISIVDIPADATVGIGRSAEQHPRYRVVELPEEGATSKGGNMPDVNQARASETTATAQPAASVVDIDAIKRDAAQAERVRGSEIQKMVRTAKFDDAVAQDMITRGITIEAAGHEILRRMAEREETVETRSAADIITVRDETDVRRDAVATALIVRAGLDNEAAKTIRANPFRGIRMLDLARDCLERASVNTRGLSQMEIVGRAFTQGTSDFPVLLETAMHKALQAAYATQADTWSRFCSIGSVSDFRAHNRYRLGSFGNLDTVNELGEFKNKTIPDGEKASITAATKGNIINLSRQAIVNDDLGAFLGLSAMLGRAARRTIEADVYALLALNSGLGPTMSDGNTLFHANHSNIAAAGAISVAVIDDARVKMASQKDVSGNDYLDLRPAVWLGPMGSGGDARVINGAEYDPDTANKLQKPNKVRGLFRDVVDTPRLTGTRFYLFADPGEAPVIEVAFLDGMQEPFLDLQDGFDVDGARYKVRLDYGTAAIDYKGAVTAAGA